MTGSTFEIEQEPGLPLEVQALPEKALRVTLRRGEGEVVIDLPAQAVALFALAVDHVLRGDVPYKPPVSNGYTDYRGEKLARYNAIWEAKRAKVGCLTLTYDALKIIVTGQAIHFENPAARLFFTNQTATALRDFLRLVLA